MNAWGIQFNHNKDPQSNDRFIKSYHADWYSIPGSGRSAGEGIGYPLQHSWASLVAHLVKNLHAMRETRVRSLGWEDPLEKRRLPIPVFWPGEFHGLCSPWSHKESDTTEQLSLSLFTFTMPTKPYLADFYFNHL